jgi:enoyl-CoA hydratase
VPIEPAPAAGIVIAADDVRFRQPETGRGPMPSGRATFPAPAPPGRGHAMRFQLTAGQSGAAQALRTGPVQQAAPAAAHLQRAADLAHLTARQAPPGVPATPASARRTRPRPGPGARPYRIAAAGHHAQPARRRRAAQLH